MSISYKEAVAFFDELYSAMVKCNDHHPETVSRMKGFFAPHSVVRFSDLAVVANSQEFKNILATENGKKFHLKVITNTPENYLLFDIRKQICAAMLREQIFNPVTGVCDGDYAFYTHYGFERIDGAIKIVWEHMVLAQSVFCCFNLPAGPTTSEQHGFQYDPPVGAEESLTYESMLNLVRDLYASLRRCHLNNPTDLDHAKRLFAPDARVLCRDIALIFPAAAYVDDLASAGSAYSAVDNRRPYFTMIDEEKKMGASWIAESVERDGKKLSMRQSFVHYAFTSIAGAPKIKWMRLVTVPTNVMIDHQPSGELEHAFA